jgi:hypothetical protein
MKILGRKRTKYIEDEREKVGKRVRERGRRQCEIEIERQIDR